MSKPLVSRQGALLVAVLLLAAVALWALLAFWSESQEVVLDEADRYPPGRWRRQPTAGMGGDPEEMARVLSLPYASGKLEATGVTGVLRHDPDRAWNGLNLYVSGHGPEAILIDMNGTLVHRWRLSFEKAFPDKRPTSETGFWRRAALVGDGGILAIFQGGGMIRLDRSSRLLWAHDEGFYNDFFVTPDGGIVAITKRALRVAEIHPTEPVLEDSIVMLGADGTLRRRISLLGALRGSPFYDLLALEGKSGDILHTNTVQVLDGSLAGVSPHFAAGNILFSLREPDTIGILDPATERVVWASRGPWQRQHEPVALPDGGILLFDNVGDARGARVLEITFPGGQIRWSYPAADHEPLWSPEAGTCARLPNGNTLITESERGRAIEVSPAGELLWEFRTPHRAGPSGELVASLLEVVRVPADGFAR